MIRNICVTQKVLQTRTLDHNKLDSFISLNKTGAAIDT